MSTHNNNKDINHKAYYGGDKPPDSRKLGYPNNPALKANVWFGVFYWFNVHGHHVEGRGRLGIWRELLLPQMPSKDKGEMF